MAASHGPFGAARKPCAPPEGDSAGRSGAQGSGTDPSAELEALIPHIVQDYCAAARVSPPGSSKEYGAHHAACRTALGHLALLVRVMRMLATGPTETDTEAPDVLLRRARDALDGDADDQP